MPTTVPTSDHRIYDPAETLPRPELAALQLERLRALVERVAQVPFYREHLSRHDIGPRGIHSLDDLRRLPFTTKADLRQHQPLGFLAVPRADVAR
ncbi:MAG TPA: phenylacetate--CoA ligase, partial [Chromatiaceae bacterium]|nr:phenylacetate--CoA ligase [Chromatiaceae bacterium]